MSPDRDPLGRRCGDPLTLLTVALLMPYAIARHGWATWRGRGGRP
jgi:hypothetical protein